MGQAPTHTFLRSTRTLQHRQSLDTAGSSSDSSLPSQKSGIKFGRAARVGALGVAAQPPTSQPQAQQRGTATAQKSILLYVEDDKGANSLSVGVLQRKLYLGT